MKFLQVYPAVLLQSFVRFSLMATGVQYEVSHIVRSMCVVRQSTALIPCQYDGYRGFSKQVSSAEWLYEKPAKPKVRVSQDSAFEGRVEFMMDSGNCSLVLRDVRDSDIGIFTFLLTDASGHNWTNTHGVRLEVTDVEMEVKTQSDVVMEGDWIFFSCGSCIPSMTVPTYTWRKDGHLHSQHVGNNLLDLESVRLEDSGVYFCIISGHEGLHSTHVKITVRPVAGESSSSSIMVTSGIAAAAFVTSVILIVLIWLLIRRKRVTRSEEQNHRGRRIMVESPEDPYMTLDPKTRCSEYDTLNNMKRSCENTDSPERQDPDYCNTI